MLSLKWTELHEVLAKTFLKGGKRKCFYNSRLKAGMRLKCATWSGLGDMDSLVEVCNFYSLKILSDTTKLGYRNDPIRRLSILVPYGHCEGYLPVEITPKQTEFLKAAELFLKRKPDKTYHDFYGGFRVVQYSDFSKKMVGAPSGGELNPFLDWCEEYGGVGVKFHKKYTGRYEVEEVMVNGVSTLVRTGWVREGRDYVTFKVAQ